ncbi:manganese catalase family protein [Marinilactibacillus psychrotolerans]|uniref:Manganese catalase family protein n=2 Tax=Marinilactibacillus psychrotolerans TaxID=191770 RepID=A0A5R9C0W9_9LACT|nr:manganese catalase family protein [Marinilactibacillus psychrotolerans]TLQ06336.1 manganese catalase family protein [Marinilactibacillus psychrotolerans]SJN45825.1 Catalase [Marinilactibacillus psychrotolerans 42ea]
MFMHSKELQYHAKPDRPDPIMARRLQEILGGQWGEMSVMNMYLFQGWNARGNEKYKDLLLDTATEEIGHVEMIATMISQLLEGAPLEAQEKAVDSDPALAAVMGGMNPQHAIVSGLGAAPRDSNGNPWTSNYIVSSGNILADMRMNVTAESQGRLQVARLYEMTEDKGIRDMLGFLLARDTQHQLQWIEAIKELEEKEGIVVPGQVPEKYEVSDVSHVLYNFSEGEHSKKVVDGKTAKDGKEFIYKAKPEVMGEKPVLKPVTKDVYNTSAMD